MSNSLVYLMILVSFLSGCVAVNHPKNMALIEEPKKNEGYSFLKQNNSNSKITIILSFSGGGTRAAALSYGVLKKLNDTVIIVGGEPRSLLTEVDVISSVSGGSFTAAYYALYQDRIFSHYEQDFLTHDVRNDLISRLLKPSRWFSDRGRTEVVNRYYQDKLFGQATFNDIDNSEVPYIIINASDITTGVRFSFIQEYFNTLCSDVGDFPISAAVTASSAVPVLFYPVLLENYKGCETVNDIAMPIKAHSYRAQKVIQSINKYSDKEKNQYIHLVDGGITDNLGLLAIYDLLEVSDFHKTLKNSHQGKHHVMVISVDASTEPELGIGGSVDFPTIVQTLDSITDIQLHRYNDMTIALFIESMNRWAREASNDDLEVIPHFIEVGFDLTLDPEMKYRFNQVPTDLVIEADIVTAIINEGGDQLELNPEYHSLMEELAVNQ